MVMRRLVGTAAVYSGIVARLVTVCVLSALSLLPAIDVVCCPDGCTDAGRSHAGWQHDVGAAHDGCGLCMNAVAVTSASKRVEPNVRLTPMQNVLILNPASTPPRSLDRPPRAT